MIRKDVQAGAVGVPIIAEIRRGSTGAVETSMGSATSLKIYLKSPDGTVEEKTAVLHTDGSDGKIKYTTVAGDLADPGTWIAQPGFTLGGFSGRCTDFSFEVKGNLE